MSSKQDRRQPDLNTVYTINADGSRNMLQVADVKGRWTTRKYFMYALLIIVYVAAPWIKVGNHHPPNVAGRDTKPRKLRRHRLMGPTAHRRQPAVQPIGEPPSGLKKTRGVSRIKEHRPLGGMVDQRRQGGQLNGRPGPSRAHRRLG